MNAYASDSCEGYASVNGLLMYYRIMGVGRPLVLLHRAFSTIDTSFAGYLPGLAATRMLIAVEFQGHGHTADIDRPLTYEQLADDCAEVLGNLGISGADVFGYSMGAGVALQLAMRHPNLVRTLIAASVTYCSAGMHAGFHDGSTKLDPAQFDGTPWRTEYDRVAPNPDDFASLVAKVGVLDATVQDWPERDVRGIRAPTLLITADSDIVRPEHSVALFRLLGGGVCGDLVGLPNAQLAIVPGTTHVGLTNRGDWLVPMINEFLDLHRN